VIVNVVVDMVVVQLVIAVVNGDSVVKQRIIVHKHKPEKFING